MESFFALVEGIGDFLWSYILIVALLGVAIYFTLRSRFVQFRLFGEMMRVVADGSEGRGGGGVSSLEAFAISLASRVGTGNLAGVAVAITIGGAGAIFWMWVVALVSAASSFVESTLAQLYKRRSGDAYVGGPAYYMESGLRARWMGVVFSVLLALTFGFAFNSVQSNTICGALELSYGFRGEVVGCVTTALTLIVIFGGVHRVARVSSVVVPIMAIGYIAIALYVMVINLGMIPSVLSQILEDAFSSSAVLGGVGAGALSEGVKRGLFSNEAGMGSAPNAAATASVAHPVKQGLIQMLGVFVDTLLICSSTAMIILLNHTTLDPTLGGIQLTQQALVSEIGAIGGEFVTIAVLLFAFSSIISSYYYGEVNIRFITSRGWVLNIYRLAVGAMVMFGAVVTLEQTIIVADLMMALMTLCNLVAIVMLGRRAIVLLVDYQRQRGAGVVVPHFSVDSLDEQDRGGVECW